MIVAWRDLRSGTYYDIYAQKVEPDGFIMWESGGVEIRAVSGSHIVTQLITPDGEGGAFVGWTDSRGSDNDIYMQRILDKGAVHWAEDGIPVCAFPGNQWLNSMVPDGNAGVILSWVDYRGAAGNVYSQKMDGEGIGSWATGGIAVCPSEDRQDYIDMAPDGNGGMISCWTDFRNPDNDIYSQMTDFMGRSGYLPPVIRSVSDIPGDQGGTVRVLWDSSPLDHMSGEITRYTVWRSIETAEALKIIESGGHLLTSPGELPISERETGDPMLRAGQLPAADYYWEFVTDVDASYFENYATTAETYFDSTAACDDFHYFQVVAHTSSPAVFWVSEVDSGYSIDNLAPAMPLNLAVAQSYSPIGLWLSWDPNNESDLGGYNIYRGTSSSFTPGPENLINSTTQTVVFDEQWTWESGYWYKVAAYDIHGNLSEFAILGPDMISGDTSGPVPGAAFLAQNWPNPFNPSTTIEFGLKSDGHVSLKIYDAAGRLVRKLIDGRMEAGTQAVVWNGLSDGGNRVSSGVYFYRIRTGEFEATRKMVLMK
jgi:hypothetical protein